MTKLETRHHAERFNLSVAEKPESQDICFVPNGNYAKVIEKLRPGAWEPGDILDLDGNVIGQHEGIINFTVGQRRGLGIAAAHPLYVVKVDPERRQVIAGPKSTLAKTELKVSAVNWIGPGAVPPSERRVGVKIRSTSTPEAGVIRCSADGWNVVFDEPQTGIAPGQAAVFYDGDRVLGGGWIQREG